MSSDALDALPGLLRIRPEKPMEEDVDASEEAERGLRRRRLCARVSDPDCNPPGRSDSKRFGENDFIVDIIEDGLQSQSQASSSAFYPRKMEYGSEPDRTVELIMKEEEEEAERKRRIASKHVSQQDIVATERDDRLEEGRAGSLSSGSGITSPSHKDPLSGPSRGKLRGRSGDGEVDVKQMVDSASEVGQVDFHSTKKGSSDEESKQRSRKGKVKGKGKLKARKSNHETMQPLLKLPIGNSSTGSSDEKYLNADKIYSQSTPILVPFNNSMAVTRNDTFWPFGNFLPRKVHFDRCAKCDRTFLSPLNLRRHMRTHRKKKPTADRHWEDLRKELAAFLSQLNPQQLRDVFSLKDVAIEGLSGENALSSLSVLLAQHKPEVHLNMSMHAELNEACHNRINAGQHLLNLTEKCLTSTSPTSQPSIVEEEVFVWLDFGSEKTFLQGDICSLALQHHLSASFPAGFGSSRSGGVSGVAGLGLGLNLGLELGSGLGVSLEHNNIVATVALLLELNILRAWLGHKEAVALVKQKALVDELEAEQLRLAKVSEKKRLRKLRHKGRDGRGVKSVDAPAEAPDAVGEDGAVDDEQVDVEDEVEEGEMITGGEDGIDTSRVQALVPGRIADNRSSSGTSSSGNNSDTGVEMEGMDGAYVELESQAPESTATGERGIQTQESDHILGAGGVGLGKATDVIDENPSSMAVSVQEMETSVNGEARGGLSQVGARSVSVVQESGNGSVGWNRKKGKKWVGIHGHQLKGSAGKRNDQREMGSKGTGGQKWGRVHPHVSSPPPEVQPIGSETHTLVKEMEGAGLKPGPTAEVGDGSVDLDDLWGGILQSPAEESIAEQTSAVVMIGTVRVPLVADSASKAGAASHLNVDPFTHVTHLRAIEAAATESIDSHGWRQEKIDLYVAHCRNFLHQRWEAALHDGSTVTLAAGTSNMSSNGRAATNESKKWKGHSAPHSNMKQKQQTVSSDSQESSSIPTSTVAVKSAASDCAEGKEAEVERESLSPANGGHLHHRNSVSKVGDKAVFVGSEGCNVIVDSANGTTDNSFGKIKGVNKPRGRRKPQIVLSKPSA